MFKTTMPLEDTWELMLGREFMLRKPQKDFSARDLTDKIATFVNDTYSINAFNLLARGGFKENGDIDRVAETGWDYREGHDCFEKNATYLGKFHHMPYMHIVEDPFLNPLMHVCKHFNGYPSLVLYDAKQMILEEEEGRGHEFGEYLFANPDDRKSAVVGIVEFDIQESPDARFMRLLSQARG